MVRNMSTEDRKNLDSELSKDRSNVVPQTHQLSQSEPQQVNGKTPPPWWKGASAAQSSIQAARDMGLAVGPVGRIK